MSLMRAVWLTLMGRTILRQTVKLELSEGISPESSVGMLLFDIWQYKELIEPSILKEWLVNFQMY